MLAIFGYLTNINSSKQNLVEIQFWYWPVYLNTIAKQAI